MKILFAVDSVFQLMIAVNLRTTIFKNDKCDIIIYDSTSGAKKNSERLEETNAFSHCFFAKTPLTYCGNNYSKTQKFSKYPIYLKSLISRLW